MQIVWPFDAFCNVIDNQRCRRCAFDRHGLASDYPGLRVCSEKVNAVGVVLFLRGMLQ